MIGDTDAPITLKPRQKPVESRQTNDDVSKMFCSRSRKYRKGALHANSATKERSERKKKSLSRERRETSSRKSCGSSTRASSTRESLEKSLGSAACRPNFRKPEVGRLLDEAMSLAIRKYKRNERAWESSGNVDAQTKEPPPKKSRAAENVDKK